MVKLIAVKPHTYGGKTIEADEEYEVEDQYVQTLVSLGRARRPDEATKVEPMKSAKPDQDLPNPGNKPTPPGHEIDEDEDDDEDEDMGKPDKPAKPDKDKPDKGQGHGKDKPTPKGGSYQTRRLKARDDR